jgi:FKBP-type peptidyl-prolyl cis-trans isomerase
MATNSGQRVAAFLLAALFLFSTIGATAYVVWEINRDDVLVTEKDQDQTADSQDETNTNTCGSAELAAVEPKAVPSVTKVDGTISELKKVDITVGDGEEVQAGDCVTVLYYGTLAKDGKKFDGNYESGQPIQLSLSGVIAGWTEGIPGMKVGGVRRLEIPFAKGYGEQGSGEVIPPSSDLIFEVQVLSTRRAD